MAKGAAGSVTSSEPPGGPVLDPATTVELKSLAKELGEHFLPELRGRFLEHAAAHLDAFESALERGDGEALRSGAHRLRGGCAAMGAVRMAAACSRLYDAQEEHAELAPLVASLRAELGAVRAAFEAA